MKCVGGGHRGDIFVEIMVRELLRGHRHGGFKQCAVAEGWIATLVFDRDGVK